MPSRRARCAHRPRSPRSSGRRAAAARRKAVGEDLYDAPRSAEASWRKITRGLDGDEREALKARALLRELFGGEVRLVPLEGGGLDARWNLHAAALLWGAGIKW
jgi:hypothetical protein